MVAAGDAAVGRGVKAGDVMKAMLPAIGGKGGGKPTLARGGGPEVDGIPAALEAGAAAVRARARRLSEAAGVKVVALDHGTARTGVAVCDETETIARPLTVVAARRHRRRVRHAARPCSRPSGRHASW